MDKRRWHSFPFLGCATHYISTGCREGDLNANSATNTQTQEDGRFGWLGRENQKHSTYIVLHTSLVLSHILPKVAKGRIRDYL